MANFVLQDRQKVSFQLIAVDADGNPAQLAPGATTQVTSSDTSSASIVPDAVPNAGTVASGFIVGGTKLQVGVQINAVVTNADGSPGPSGQVLVDIVAGPATSVSIGLGSPVPQ